MDFFLKLIPDSWEQIAVAAAICGALGWSIKKIPDILAAKAIELIEKAFAMGSPSDDKLFVAMLVWAEERFGPGSGAVKAAFLVDKVVALLPVQYRIFVTAKVRAKILELFQKSFDRLEAVFLAQIAEHKGIPADNVPPIP